MTGGGVRTPESAIAFFLTLAVIGLAVALFDVGSHGRRPGLGVPLAVLGAVLGLAIAGIARDALDPLALALRLALGWTLIGGLVLFARRRGGR
jgi:H+/Cl- antiporter ClcA